MTDPYSLDPIALVEEGSQRWRVGLRLPWFRALPLSCIERVSITTEGHRAGHNELWFTLGDVTGDFNSLSTMSDRYWSVTDTLWLAPMDGSKRVDPEDVADVAMTLRMPDGRGPDGTWPMRVARATVTFAKSWTSRLGVCTFSFAGELRQGRSIEACLDDAAALGYAGVELLGAQVVEGYPAPSEQSLERLSRAVRAASLIPVCYDAFTDPGRDEAFRDDESRILGWAISEMDIASRLGCAFMRLNVPVRSHLLERVSTEGAKRGLTILTELHAQTANDSAVHGLLEILRNAGSASLGLVLDLSCVMRSLPAGYVDRILRPALPEPVIAALEDFWIAGEPTSTFEEWLGQLDAATRQKATGLWARTNRLFRRSDIDWLDQVLPFTRIVHGKFFGMETADEPAIPYQQILAKLEHEGFDGYIMSEYEGHLWTEHPDTFGQLSAHRNLIASAVHV